MPSEDEESEDKGGMMVSEGFVEDMLQKAEKQAKVVAESMIERTLAERDYDFKLDVLTKKYEEGIG